MAKRRASRKPARLPLRSEFLASGTEAMPHRALLFATGFSRSQLGKPLIGVASSFTDLVPGRHLHALLNAQDAVGDRLREPPAIGVLRREPVPVVG